MDIATVFFYSFAAVLLFAGLRVITAKNPVHAVLYLVLAFTQASALWLLLGAEFLAITLIVVYVGAVMVLFLFVVMMLDIRIEHIKARFWKLFPAALALGGLIAAEIIAVVSTGFSLHAIQSNASDASHTNSKALGKLMYSEYLYPVEVASAILLLAIIAAVTLTLRSRKDARTPQIAAQLSARASERLKLIKDSK